MPVYEYECLSCGGIEEAFQKISEKPLTKCKRCSGKLQKLISQSSFHLKGSGWYVTDYAGKPARKDTSSNKSDTASTKENNVKASNKSAGKSSTASKSPGAPPSR